MSSNAKFTQGILKNSSWNSKEQEVTPEAVFNARRNIIKAMGLGAIGASLPGQVQAGIFDLFGKKDTSPGFITHALTYNQNKLFTTDETLTPIEKVTRHNNFYEFGTAKHEPANNARNFNVDPWKLVIEGEVDNPITLDLDDLTKLISLEERTYRLRCVEAWSMVVPWVGFPLAALLKKAGIKSSATHVAFETLFDPEQMPGQKNRLLGGGIHYPYVEGLTINEAMNDLSFMAVGLYGKTLPPQNGAPIRLVVPWKYGFKSIKSIVRIRVMDKQPPTSWNQLASREYGFYANVNPAVPHPRWSQASERRISEGGLFSAERIPTQMFNGYGEFVSDLYKGLDLRKNY